MKKKKLAEMEKKLAEKEKEIEKLNEYSSNIHDVLELCVNVERNKDDFRRYFPSKNPENTDSDTEKIWNIFVNKCEIKVQFAALKIEHNELEKEHSDRGLYLAEKEKEIENLEEIIEIWKNRASELLALELEKEKEIGELKKDWERKLVQWRGKLDSICSQLINTKSIFKSKRIADIRDQTMKLDWEVWEAYCTISSNPLPPPINLFKIQPSEPWPRRPERKSIIIGYQPESDNVDPNDPPQGGSGLK